MSVDHPFNPESFMTQMLLWFNERYPAQTTLSRAMGYALKSPGKRIRPQLIFESGALFHVDPHALEKVAFAVEMVHAFSLVHDDLPCLDNDDFRRGLPSTHKKFGEAQGLLAGDALFALAFEAFNEGAFFVSPQNYLRGFQYFCRCLGPEGLTGGQSLEIEIQDPTTEHLLKIQAMKTTALFRAAILIPAIFAGESENGPKFKELLEFADAFGFAFQIADDLEDEAQDQAQKLKNILSLMGRDAAKKLASERLTSHPTHRFYASSARLLKKLTD